MAKKKNSASVPIDAHKHIADKRRNIPTRETSAMLDLPKGVALKWRVQAVAPFGPPGKLSAWQDLPAQ